MSPCGLPHYNIVRGPLRNRDRERGKVDELPRGREVDRRPGFRSGCKSAKMEIAACCYVRDRELSATPPSESTDRIFLSIRRHHFFGFDPLTPYVQEEKT